MVRARASLFGLEKLTSICSRPKRESSMSYPRRAPQQAPDRAPFERTQALLLWLCGHIADVFSWLTRWTRRSRSCALSAIMNRR